MGRGFITMDDKNIRRLERELGIYRDIALPHATQRTINKAVFDTMKTSKIVVRNKMTLRNKFTEKSIQFDGTKSLDVNRQVAFVGSTLDYMRVQEFGGTETKGGKEGVAIPTTFSSGEAMGAKERKRVPKRLNRLKFIRLQRKRKGGVNRGHSNVIAVKEAKASGRKFVFLDLKRRKGIFKVLGSVKKPIIRMVHDLTRSTITIPRTQWLGPSVKINERRLPGNFVKEMERQVRRRQLFRSR